MNDIIATFMFFTRLPLWRISKVPADSFKRIVAYWPLTGLLTGGVMTAVYLLAIYLHFHAITAVLFAFISRLLLTGALHEDGLADFFDGFGGGHTREQVLSIMKDSHTGSYGVLGLILYIFLWVSSVFILTQQFNGGEYIIFFTCDIWSKWCASQIVNRLPYARKEEDSKIKKTYDRMSPGRFITGFIFGILPFICMLVSNFCGYQPEITDITTQAATITTEHNALSNVSSATLIMIVGAIMPFIIMLLLAGYMRRRIQGYTGDCCGAMFLLCELSYLLILICLWKFI
ncbi:MAG: adenosylcobinamide-GDP ribazoletransferase [Tannerella sp.]|jgi:adenosylcobinamide-GDP ribazoletransferase|nr:adenosylcobinamide-GDP ribazoletransferase [Tannerella sp.]